MQTEFVYLIKSGEHYKIGRTKNVRARIKQISTGSPFDVKLVHLIECIDSAKTERELHDKYAHAQMRGEWFDLSSSEVNEICSIPSDTKFDTLWEQTICVGCRQEFDADGDAILCDSCYGHERDVMLLLSRPDHILACGDHKCRIQGCMWTGDACFDRIHTRDESTGEIIRNTYKFFLCQHHQYVYHYCSSCGQFGTGGFYDCCHKCMSDAYKDIADEHPF